MICFSLKNPSSVCYKGFHRQLSASSMAYLVALGYGLSLGWITPMLYLLQSKDSPLPFRITIEDTSWIGSLANAGGLIGTIFFGYIIDRAGRKLCLYLLPLPQIVFWTFAYFSSNVYHLYAARFIDGITGGGIFLIFPLFLSEIADPKIRGTLASFIPLSINVGVLVGYITASHVSYFITPAVVVVLPVFSLLLATQFPETPQHLLRKGYLDQAKNSLEFYTNYKRKDMHDEAEFSSKFFELKTAVQLATKTKKPGLHDFCERRSLKAMATGLTIVFINVFCGFFAIIAYSTQIFAETKSTINPNTSTIVVGVVMIFGSYFASFFVDSFGRKTLMMISTGCMGLGLNAIGTYTYFTHRMGFAGYPFLPVLIVGFIIFFGSTGITAINSVLIVEVLPPKIRSLGMTICQIIMGIISFGALKIFPILMAKIGLYGVMWIFGSVATFGFFFFAFCIEETKGKSLDNDDSFK